MTKKNTIIFALLFVIAFALFALFSLNLFAKRQGIDFSLWFDMPDQSQFNLSDPNSKTISIQLELLAKDFSQITDFQVVPGTEQQWIVLQKTGQAFLLNLEDSTRQEIFEIPVITDSEQGLLGIAFHPQYPYTPCLYLNYVQVLNNQDTSRVVEWCHQGTDILEGWGENRTMIEVVQPYKNHNAGHLIFDQSGNLYIPWGDGGKAEDPHGNGQNMQTFLGKILRITPTAIKDKNPYTIPSDNPFVEDPNALDEIYAYGLRNPWKLAFDDRNRLIAADVGQYLWEEVTFIERGKNHGWKNIEGSHCFVKACETANSVLPFVEYGHDLGRSITGGYQYTSDESPSLKNKYIFGDFVTGQLWAADLPEIADNTKNELSSTLSQINTTDQARSTTTVYNLGQWPLLVSTFAKDSSGNVLVADFARGKIFKIKGTKARGAE